MFFRTEFQSIVSFQSFYLKYHKKVDFMNKIFIIEKRSQLFVNHLNEELNHFLTKCLRF